MNAPRSVVGFIANWRLVTPPKPFLVLNSDPIARLKTITPAGMPARMHPTMTDGYPYAFAQVIIDAAPEATP